MHAPFKKVRLPTSVDPEVGPSVSLEAMMSKIADLSTIAPPLTRNWRADGSAAEIGSEGVRLRFMQFNLLAEGLSSSPHATPPFSSTLDGRQLDPSNYGDFDSVDKPETVFDFNGFRKWRILQEVK